MSNYLKSTILGLALCGPAAFAQNPTITEEQSGSGTAVADSKDTESDAGIPWAMAGVATIAGIVVLSWAYLRYRDNHKRSSRPSTMEFGETP